MKLPNELEQINIKSFSEVFETINLISAQIKELNSVTDLQIASLCNANNYFDSTNYNALLDHFKVFKNRIDYFDFEINELLNSISDYFERVRKYNVWEL